jgi:hypothetical protein
MARKLFISYTHHDADLMGELRAHLRPLERAGVVTPWFDGYLIPGDEFDRKVREALAETDFIAALVTARFLDSDYCMDVEMEEAIRRHQLGSARVVPIIAKPCRWKLTSLSDLLATPTDGKAVTTWANQDQAWDIVAQAIERAAAAPVEAPSVVANRRPVELREAQTPEVARRSPPRTAFSIPKSTRPTDQQKDDFRHEAFEIVADAFEASITALEGPVAGRFRRLDANRFTATLYREGQKIAGCTVFTGTGHFGANGIAYSGNDNGETNSMNEDLIVEVGEEGLSLRATMSGHFGGGRDRILTPEEGAAQLWNMLTDRLRY